ncbi:hypothetical protein VTJ04DRAFT_2770 [Mycothermus thermophilus]|uniref:uncharacterized protein n=1 Tax=Humicola insolens TaxID=85995 RepID=UPI00374447D9
MFAKPRIRKTAPPPPKKRKTVHAIEEITFDPKARTEYLTGFHKRKQERKKRAQEIAEKKAREMRIEMRRQIREERKQQVEEHVQAITKILREAEYAGTEQNGADGTDSDEEWGGLSDQEEQVPEAPIDVEEEYIDEDKYTTVTVEAVSVDRDGLHKPELDKPSEDDESEAEDDGEERKDQDKSEEKKRPKYPKKKKKKFRYENKLERALEARKQKARKKKLKGN